MIPQWSNVLSEAQVLNSKTAKKILDKSDINGVIWKPYEEKHTPKRFKVVLSTNTYSYEQDTPYYTVTEEYVTKNSDMKYLLNKGAKEANDLYSKQDAEILAIKMNTKLIEKLNEINKENKHKFRNKFKI